MPVDATRHLEVFDPDRWGDRRIDVIGAGATGSRIAVSLAKLGITNLHVWDDDVVEEHNVANQIYGNEHIGQFKVDALQQIIQDATGTNIFIYRERACSSIRCGEVVFLLTDTMESRREIWEGLKWKPHIGLVIETRMGVDQGRIYAIHPINPAHIRRWEETLYDDEESEVSACGSKISVGPTAELISGYAVWQFLRWAADTDAPLENEIIFGVRPCGLMGTTW